MKIRQTLFLACAALLGGEAAWAAPVNITAQAGWLETAYVEWDNGTYGAFNVYVKSASATDWTKLDAQLVRKYGTKGRADALGLKAGTYSLKVVPVGSNQAEVAADAATADNLQVKAHDRNGYAHFNYTEGIGAYNNDGTLKKGAKVLYVTKETAKTISTEVIVGSGGKKDTFTGIQAIVNAYQKELDQTPIAFRFIGTVTKNDLDYVGSSAEGLQVKGKGKKPMNLTFEGVGSDATVWGFGFLIRSATSIEFRNFALMCFMDDGLSFDTDNHHCWAHNIDIFYGSTGGDSDQAKGDGSVDVKGNSQFMTFSYIHFWDSGKCSLCGMKSESGPNYITYHHNWFDHSDSRHPRVRTMTVHVYNNYYDGCSKYGAGSTMGSDLFVECNYFRNCKFPMLTSEQGSDLYAGATERSEDNGTFSGEVGGSIKSWNNTMVGNYTYIPYNATSYTCKGNQTTAAAQRINTAVDFDAYEAKTRAEKVPANVAAYKGGATYSNFDSNSSTMYQFTPETPEAAKTTVTGAYGAGRCQGGNYKWTFGKDEDTNYGVITTLKSQLVAYPNSTEAKSWGFYDGTVASTPGASGTDTDTKPGSTDTSKPSTSNPDTEKTDPTPTTPAEGD